MYYKVNGKEYATWQGKNSAIMDKLVGREVYCCMTMEMEYMLRRVWEGDNDNPFDESDLYEIYEKICDECDCTSFVETENEDGETVYECTSCGKLFTEEEYDNLDEERREIYEWWAVSRWFGEKLREQGCFVIESYGKSYWGREGTGQAISLDGCVCKIAYGMEILEGQKYEWDV